MSAFRYTLPGRLLADPLAVMALIIIATLVAHGRLRRCDRAA